jgi:preprotein translocase subunit YajC
MEDNNPQGNGTVGGGGGFGSMIFMFAMMFAVMYFLIIRPQQQQKKQLQLLQKNLKKHDKVVTSSGIIGKVTDIDEKDGTVEIRVDESTNTKVVFLASTIVNVLKSGDEKE